MVAVATFDDENFSKREGRDMDVRTGRIVEGEIQQLIANGTIRNSDVPYMRQISPTAKQFALRRVGRNDPCPCGSGKKFKKCCLNKKVV